jgi:hypothetical protein
VWLMTVLSDAPEGAYKQITKGEEGCHRFPRACARGYITGAPEGLDVEYERRIRSAFDFCLPLWQHIQDTGNGYDRGKI